MREVDASLRYTIGSADVLVTVECRDRSRRPDSTWIEQLHSKQEAIGSSKTIAVSSKPFSSEAESVAHEVGIETRVLSAVQDDDIARWARLLEVTESTTTISNQRVLVERWGTEPLDERTREWLMSVVREHAFDGAFVSVPADERLRSPLDFLRERASPLPTLPSDGRDVAITLAPKASLLLWKDPAERALVDGVPPDGTIVDREVPIDFDPGRAFLRFGDRSWQIKRITLCYQAQSQLALITARSLFQYEGPSGALADVAEVTHCVGKDRLSMFQVRRSRSDARKPPSKAAGVGRKGRAHSRQSASPKKRS